MTAGMPVFWSSHRIIRDRIAKGAWLDSLRVGKIFEALGFDTNAITSTRCSRPHPQNPPAVRE